MKILYLCADLGIPVLGRKGASIHVRSMAAALDRAGHSVLLVSPVLNKSPWEEPAPFETPLCHLPPGSDTAAAAALMLKAFHEALGMASSLPGELRRILYNQELVTQLKHRFEGAPPEFIYERASLYTTAGAVLAEIFNVPLLLELNAPLALEQSTYRGTGLGELAEQAERWTLSRAGVVLAVSHPLRAYVVSLGVEPDRVHVLPNGVNPALFHPGPPTPEIRERWRLGEGPILGFVSGLRPWHGVEALPGLLERLTPRHPDLRLVIVGEGPLLAQMERDFRERKLMHSVVFTGSLPHEEIGDLIRQFDVALAPYPRPEHTFYFSPLKLFEYMACGVPVVAAGLGQIAEVVRDGETGLLYPPGDLEGFVAACERLLAEPALRRRLGRAAAEEIRERYTWDHNAASVIDLARSLIAARAARKG